MKKRRIEVTRERWTRIRIECGDRAVCPFCRGAPDLALLPGAAERSGVTAEDLKKAIRSGLLPVSETPEGKTWVCLDCLRKLKEEKAI